MSIEIKCCNCEKILDVAYSTDAKSLVTGPCDCKCEPQTKKEATGMRIKDFNIKNTPVSRMEEKPQPEEIGLGFKFIGLAKTGEYTYSRNVGGKEKIYAVNPDTWEDTKHIYQDAIKKNANVAYSLQRLRLMLSS